MELTRVLSIYSLGIDKVYPHGHLTTMEGRGVNFSFTSHHVIVALAIALLGWPTGLLIRMLIIRRLEAWAAGTSWRGDDILIASIRRPVPIWFFLLGIYVASRIAGLPSEYATIANRVIESLLILSVTIWISDLVARLLALVPTGRGEQAFALTGVVQVVARATVIGIGLLVLLGTLGISVAPIITTLGVGGLAVALGLQETLANVFAGIHITLARNIRPGDFVKLETGEEGTIEDIGWRTTRVRLLSNNIVLVPNNRLAQSVVTNYDIPGSELAVLIPVGVHYSSDLRRVEETTCAVAREVQKDVPGAVPEFEPFVRYHTFGDSSIDFTVILRAKTFTANYLIKHEFIKRLHDRYARENIVIPFPIRAINTSQESTKP